MPNPPWSAIDFLTSAHDVSGFECGNHDANSWIREKAVAESGRVSTHIALDSAGSICGYYALKTVAVTRDDMSSAFRGNAESKTAVLLCWIALDNQHQRQGHFPTLLHAAMAAAAQADALSSVDLFVLDPRTPDLAERYQQFQFKPLKRGSTRLGMKMTHVRELVGRLADEHA